MQQQHISMPKNFVLLSSSRQISKCWKVISNARKSSFKIVNENRLSLTTKELLALNLFTDKWQTKTDDSKIFF